MLTLFLKGLLIGFSIAAPVGPIGILCINRTLASGMLAGLTSGLGAAVADAFYGCVAGFGLASVSTFLLSQKTLIQLIGGIFLNYLGIKTFHTHTQHTAIKDKANTLWKDFTSTLFLTITNPMTIISFMAIYASLGIVESGARYQEAILIVIGVFIGSLLWWGVLSTGVHIIRHKLSEQFLIWINRFSAMILSGFGLFAFLSAIITK